MSEDAHLMGDSHEKRLADTARRLDEKVGYIQDLLSEKIDHLRSEVQGNDRRYAERFNAQEAATKYAQEKSNEFRGALDDVNHKQMPRTESEALHRATAEKIADLQTRLDRNEGKGTIVDPMVAQLANEVAGLKASRSESSGEKSGRVSQQQLIQWVLYLILAALAIAAFVRK